MASSNTSLMIQFRKYKKNILDISRGHGVGAMSCLAMSHEKWHSWSRHFWCCFAAVSYTLHTTRIGSYWKINEALAKRRERLLNYKSCVQLQHFPIGHLTPRQSVHIRDSRFSRLGTETPRLSVQVSSQNRNWNSGLKSLGIGLGTETLTFLVSESEPESKIRHSKSQNRNRNWNLVSVVFI